MPAFCKTETDGRLLTVTLDRPEVLNALHAPAHVELTRVFDDFVASSQLAVAIITGAGRAFSAGNDLKYTAAGGSRNVGPTKGFAGLTARFDNPKPIIAAVNGVAMGGGFETALACDLIIAAESAVFALPEPRVGLAALAGGLQRLPRQIPLKQAMGMILTGRHVHAEEALRLGIATDLVPDDQLMKAARDWAEQILECAPRSVRASKQAVMEGLDKPLPQAMSARYEQVDLMRAHADFREGPRAFAQKRKPDWTGW
ncbi:MAG: enoyl-CoA hydratase-related protein [Myxococcota bacterium]